MYTNVSSQILRLKNLSLSSTLLRQFCTDILVIGWDPYNFVQIIISINTHHFYSMLFKYFVCTVSTRYYALWLLSLLLLIILVSWNGKNANFSLSLVIIILNLSNRYLSLITHYTKLVIVSYFIIIVISIVMSVQSIKMVKNYFHGKSPMVNFLCGEHNCSWTEICTITDTLLVRV